MKKTVKKTISAIIAIAIMLSLSVSAFAASASISADKTSLKKGETVTVDLTLSDTMQNITNFEYSIYFDPELYELQSSAKGSACSLTQISNLKTDTKGSFYSVSFVDTTSEGVEINAGTIYSLTFKAVKDVAEATASSFELKKVSVMDTTWSQVADADIGTEAVSIEVSASGEEGGDTADYADITLTLSAPASVAKAAGTEFNAIIYTTEWDEQTYKLLDCIVNIPAGLEVTSVAADSRLSGGALSWNTDSENKLRIVYNDANGLTTITVSGTDYPAPLFTIGLKTTSALTADSATVVIGGASLKLNSDSESDASINILKIGTVADDQGNTGGATVNFTQPGEIVVTAAELFIGDGVDIIPADKKGIVVSVNGLSASNVKLAYSKGDVSVDLLYSAEITALVGNISYVAVVGKDEPIDDYAVWSNYTADTTKTAEPICFGDTNGDETVNAQDALNAINVWIRSKELTEDKDYLVYNVNSDARINTFDALGVEEAFVNSSSYKIITRAAGLVSGS